jgi:hypothetical protein
VGRTFVMISPNELSTIWEPGTQQLSDIELCRRIIKAGLDLKVMGPSEKLTNTPFIRPV